MLFPGSPAVNAATGAAAGLGGEGAAQLAGDSPWARIVGALTGGLGGYGAIYAGKTLAQLLGLGSRAPQMVAESTKDMRPQDWAKAEQTMREAKSLGQKITPAQAVEGPAGIHKLQETVLESEAGGKLAAGLKDQGAQGADMVRRGLLGGVPDTEPVELAKNAEKAATDAINTAGKMRTAATAGDYGTAFNPQNGLIGDLTKALRARRDALGETTDAGLWFKSNVLDRIDPKWSVIDDGPKVMEILNDVRKKLSDKLTPLEGGAPRHSKAQIQQMMEPLEQWAAAQSVARPQAQARFAEISRGLNDPLKEGPIGTMAGRTGAQEGQAPAVQRVLTALSSDKIRAQTITEAQQWLHHEQPGLFAQIARNHVTGKIETAFKAAEPGVAAPDAPAKLAAALWGTPQQTAQRENFRAMIHAAAKDQGMSAQEAIEAVRGAEKMMRTLEALGRAKGSLGEAIGKEAAGETLVLRAGASGPANTAHFRFLGSIADRLNNRAYSEIADMLLNPEGMKQLRKWSQFDINAIRSGAALTTGASATQQIKE